MHKINQFYENLRKVFGVFQIECIIEFYFQLNFDPNVNDTGI